MSGLCISQFKWAYAVDIVFLLMLFLFAFLDAKKGFIGCFFALVSTVVAIVVALLCAGGFQSLTGGLFGLEGVIAGGLTNVLSGVKGLNVDVSPSGIEGQLANASLPQFLKDKVVQLVQSGAESIPAGTTIAMKVGEVLARFIVLLIAAVVLFILTKLLMLLLKHLLNKFVESLTAIRKVNRLLGMCVGLLKAFAITCGLLAILAIFPSQGITDFFNDTILLSGLYNNNPIHAVFGLFIS